jgi:hypothetical protein
LRQTPTVLGRTPSSRDTSSFRSPFKASENDLGTLDQAGLLSTATGKAHQFRSLLGRTRQRHRDPGHTTPQLVCRPEVSYKISHFNAIKH